MKIGLSVVIPAYNEEENVASCLEKVNKVLKTHPEIDAQIILVNDGSKDKTGKIAENYKNKIGNLTVVHNNPNRGYGGSLKAGFEKAEKEFIVFTPADNQFDFSEVTKLIDKQKETDSDIVSGIRVGGGVDPIHRKLNRWGWNTVVRALFGYLATDIDCGFKLFRREILSHVYIPAERGAMIDTQLFASARAKGFSVAEIPLTHLPRTAGKSTGANFRVIIQSFIDLITFWWQLKKEILVERGLAVFPWEMIAIFSILIISLFLRLYKIDQYMTFLGDEGRDALVLREIVLGQHVPLIGPGTSIGNMYLGPLYYYLTAPAIAIAKLSPVGPAVEVALFGVLTVGLIWWIGRQWFGRISALVSSVLYAIAPTVIIYSRSSWNPNIMPFFALLAIYSIWKVWRFGYWRWLLVTAISMAFVLNSHYLGLILLPTICFVWLLRKKTPESKKYSLLALIIFCVCMSPLLFFDLRHNWQNSRAVKQFFTNRENTVNLKAYKSFPKIIPTTSAISETLLAAKKPQLNIYIIIFVSVTFIYAAFSKKISKDIGFLLLWFFIGCVGLSLYKQHVYDHYYGFLFPVPFLLFGFCISILLHQKNILVKSMAVIISSAVIFINLSQNPLKFSPNNQLKNTQMISEFIKEKSSDQPFNLALLSKSNYDASYRYFLTLNQSQYKKIDHQKTNQLYVICEYQPCSPIGNPLWEIAAFGWAKIDSVWNVSGVEIYRLLPNPQGS